jgi:hypothetical protein
MACNVYLTLQPDNDWVITSFEDEAAPLSPHPELPYIRVEADLVSLQDAILLKYNVRALPPFIQNHLKVTPGHVTMSIDTLEIYLTLT